MSRSLLAAVMALVTLACGGYAQGLGTLVGTLTDPSGAVVPSAKVAVTEVGTGFSRSVNTDQQGYYVIPSLRPADYDLTVEAPGFRKFSQPHVTLLADQTATVNVKLEVGKATESVTVEAVAAQVDTSTPTLKQVVDQARMVELPLNGRNAAALTLLVAGAVNSPGGGAEQGQTKTFPGAVTISTNGSRQNQVSYQLDGGNNVDEYTNVNQPFPFPDALQEFSVQTSNYTAEYGQNAGGVVNIITKSGANELHGNAFGFLRNAVFNARNFFESDRDQLKRPQFGGTIGGPVVIPGHYNGRNRTFFFAGYQGTRIRNVQGARNAFVPTQANIKGDFSALLKANDPNNPLGKEVVQLKDPVTRQPIPGNIVDPSRFDPASLGVLKFLPQASGSGLVFFTRPISQNFDEVVGRVDHSVRDKDRLTFRYFYDRFKNAPIFSSNNILTYADGSTIVSQNFLLHESHIFRANLLNDFRFSYSRVGSGRGPAPGVPNVRDFGVNIPFQPPVKAVQSISVSGFFSFGDNPPARFTRNNFAWSDDVSWVKGRHNLSFGGSFERSRVDIDNLFLSPGTFSFKGNPSRGTGSAIADFLLGKLDSFRQGFGEFKNNRNNFIGVYVQDDLHATRRLTLNFGLRYEPFLPWREIRGRVEQFRINDFFAGRKSTKFVNAPPGLFFPGDAGVPENGTGNDLNNFAPRVGFAYDVFGDGKTSLRGGAGLFYDSRQVGIVNNRFVDVTPFSPQLTLTPPPGPFSDPLRGIASPFPAPFPPPQNAPFPRPVLAVTYDPSTDSAKFVVPLTYNWNLAIEHQLAPSWVFRAAYVGSHSSHLKESVELNPAVFFPPSDPRSTLSTDRRRIFQEFASIAMDSQAINSSYNSLQLTLEKRFTRGLTILANYTYSHAIDDLPVGGGVVDVGAEASSVLPWNFPGRHRFDRGPADFDHRHRFVASYVWQLPKLADASPVVRGVFGAWEVSGVFSSQTGGPLTIEAGKDQSQTNLGHDRAVLVGSPFGRGACGSKAPCVDYLNVDAFQLPTAGTFGNVGKGSLSGPDFLNWDMGFFKNIRTTERLKIQFRAEFFNIFNITNLNNPTTRVNDAGFGSIRGASDARIGQLALKIFF